MTSRRAILTAGTLLLAPAVAGGLVLPVFVFARQFAAWRQAGTFETFCTLLLLPFAMVLSLTLATVLAGTWLRELRRPVVDWPPPDRLARGKYRYWGQPLRGRRAGPHRRRRSRAPDPAPVRWRGPVGQEIPQSPKPPESFGGRLLSRLKYGPD